MKGSGDGKHTGPFYATGGTLALPREKKTVSVSSGQRRDVIRPAFLRDPTKSRNYKEIIQGSIRASYLQSDWPLLSDWEAFYTEIDRVLVSVSNM